MTTEMVSKSSSVAELVKITRGDLKFAQGGRTEKGVEIEV